MTRHYIFSILSCVIYSVSWTYAVHITASENAVVRGISGSNTNSVQHLHNDLGVHVDLPGHHGNTANVPVVHRPSSSLPHVTAKEFTHHSSHGSAGHQHSTDTHVDLPGQHGNQSPVPVIHRGSGHGITTGGLGAIDIHGGGIHVDLPGQHGNTASIPVVHRDPHRTHAHGSTGSSGIHVDLPGQHGNMSPMPVVHRDAVGHTGSGSGIHVDLPGQHGNMASVPVIHRDHGGGGGDIHVDLPGSHGNTSPHPVVHRDSHDTHGHGTESHVHGLTFPSVFDMPNIPSSPGFGTPFYRPPQPMPMGPAPFLPPMGSFMPPMFQPAGGMPYRPLMFGAPRRGGSYRRGPPMMGASPSHLPFMAPRPDMFSMIVGNLLSSLFARRR